MLMKKNKNNNIVILYMAERIRKTSKTIKSSTSKTSAGQINLYKFTEAGDGAAVLWNTDR